jgi:hypothetical protein
MKKTAEPDRVHLKRAFWKAVYLPRQVVEGTSPRSKQMLAIIRGQRFEIDPESARSTQTPKART